jgi:4-methyl-5(b-hydroxyethyl)-thiazole monophosphate biosynthesis
MKNVLVPLAEGFEEIEAVTVIDLLRRAGLRVTVAGLAGTTATGSHGITLACDRLFEHCDVNGADALVLPGGMPGSVRLRESGAVRGAVTHLVAAGRLVGAICAAPTVLEASGVLAGKRATSHPNHAAEMRSCHYEDAAVVEDGNIITSRGAGTSIDFAAALIRRLVGEEAAREVLSRIQYRSAT